ncbi:NfeD family protein [Baaleninema sp.]|uniref:NfeD family protein n=1 Tax=Baaleninema sp. TaxID=3101197 RepID=UPI003D056D81
MTLFEANSYKMFPCPLCATVTSAVSPEMAGRVFFKGTYWPARFYTLSPQSLVQPGQSVNIVGRDGITLLILPRSNRQVVSQSTNNPSSNLPNSPTRSPHREFVLANCN